MPFHAKLLSCALLVLALPLAGCDRTPTPRPNSVYASTDLCVADGHSKDECDKAMAAATNQHASTAPKFDTIDSCQSQFARCQPVVVNGHSSFMPFMEGFLLARMLSGPSHTTTYVSTPMYRPYGSMTYSSYRTGVPGAAAFTPVTARVATPANVLRASPPPAPKPTGINLTKSSTPTTASPSKPGGINLTKSPSPSSKSSSPSRSTSSGKRGR